MTKNSFIFILGSVLSVASLSANTQANFSEYQNYSKECADNLQAYNDLPQIYKDVIDETFGGILGLASTYHSINNGMLQSYRFDDMQTVHVNRLLALCGNPEAQRYMYNICMLESDNLYNEQHEKKLFEAQMWDSLSKQAQIYYNDDGDIIQEPHEPLANLIKKAFFYASRAIW